MNNRNEIRERGYKRFSRLLKNNETTPDEIYIGYAEVKEELELLMDGARKAIEEYYANKE